MRRLESIDIPGYSGGSLKRYLKGHTESDTDEVINPDEFNIILDFLKSLGLILISIYRLGRSTDTRRYSIAAALSSADPVLLLTIEVDGERVTVDELNKHLPTITNIHQKIYHQLFFHIYNGTGIVSLAPMYLTNSLRSLTHRVFEVPTQLKEFLNVKT